MVTHVFLCLHTWPFACLRCTHGHVHMHSNLSIHVDRSVEIHHTVDNLLGLGDCQVLADQKLELHMVVDCVCRDFAALHTYRYTCLYTSIQRFVHIYTGHRHRSIHVYMHCYHNVYLHMSTHMFTHMSAHTPMYISIPRTPRA